MNPWIKYYKKGLNLKWYINIFGDRKVTWEKIQELLEKDL